jgi:hypothetical protein
VLRLDGTVDRCSVVLSRTHTTNNNIRRQGGFDVMGRAECDILCICASFLPHGIRHVASHDRFHIFLEKNLSVQQTTGSGKNEGINQSYKYRQPVWIGRRAARGTKSPWNVPYRYVVSSQLTFSPTFLAVHRAQVCIRLQSVSV